MRRVAVAAAILVTLAACGDAAGDTTTSAAFPADQTVTTSPTGTSAPSTSAVPATTTTEPASTTTPPITTGPQTTTTAGPATTSPPVGSDIGDLLTAGKQARVRATYTLENQETMVLSQDPPRSALLLEGVKFISDGANQQLLCIEPDEGLPGQCIETGPGLETSAFFDPLLSFALLEAGNISDIPGLEVDTAITEVDGFPSICLVFTATDLEAGGADTIKQCVHAELGILVSMSVTEAGSEPEIVFLLIELGEPLPEDFEPTGPIISTP